jgi:catechol 2,3-dioxygenase-like lactoylglutathione lyase family enzyme
MQEREQPGKNDCMKRLLTASILCMGSLAFAQGEPSSKPSPVRLDKVGYVMLGVASVPASVAFYHEKLGLEVTMQSGDLAFFNAGTVAIAVSSEVGRKVGDEEVVFVVDHVQAAFDAMSQAGIAFERKPHALTETAWAASFRDPDGHVLSLYGPR